MQDKFEEKSPFVSTIDKIASTLDVSTLLIVDDNEVAFHTTAAIVTFLYPALKLDDFPSVSIVLEVTKSHF